MASAASRSYVPLPWKVWSPPCTSATSGVDFQPGSGTLSFAAGQAARAVTVSVVGDVDVEPGETFRVLLSSAQGAVIADGEAVGTILDDDRVAPPNAASFAEIRHGAVYEVDLGADGDRYALLQSPDASYEVVVDAVSGDAPPVALGRWNALDQLVQPADAVGTGTARSLRWRVAGTASVADETVRVAGACGTACGPDDVYRIRAYETTLRAARFNNSASQTTVVVLQNTGDAPVAVDLRFWGGDGALVAAHVPAGPVPPHGVLVLDTATVAPASSGSVTVAHDAPYGVLVGKAVALEPGTGFAFDTPLEPRPR
ncbi:MAG: DUF5719 family protein [Vicinamibacteria bacterium]